MLFGGVFKASLIAARLAFLAALAALALVSWSGEARGEALGEEGADDLAVDGFT